MEIIIYGNRYGQQVFFNSNPKIVDVTTDFRDSGVPTSISEKAIGSEFYGLSYSKEGVVFSKIRVILDVPGEETTGVIAFSLISKAKEINAENIKSILDDYVEDYFKKYNIENSIIREIYQDDAGSNKKLLDDLKIKHEFYETTETYAKTNLDYYQSANKNPAYIYYNSEEDLLSYFNNPFWTEYRKNSMVYLIDSKYKNTPENPLNALRHTEEDNLTEIIKYKVRPFELKIEDLKPPYEKIEIELNDIPVETGIYFREQDALKIKLKKKYFETKVIKGDNTKYFNTKDLVKTLNLKVVESELIPEKPKIITFNVKDDRGTSLNNYFKFNLKSPTTSFNKESIGQELSVDFKGSQIEEEWELKYISSDNSSDKYFLKEPVFFIPEKESQKTIILTRCKEIQIIDYDTRNPITDVSLKLTSGKEQSLDIKETKVKFVGSQIDKEWEVEFNSSWMSVNNIYKIETKVISPNKDSLIILKKEKSYTIVSENGKELSDEIRGFYYEGESKTKGKNKEFFKEIKKKLKELNAIPDSKKILDYEVNGKNIKVEFSEKNKFFKKISQHKKTKLFAFIATAVLFIIIGAGGIYFYFKGSKSSSTTEIDSVQKPAQTSETVIDSAKVDQETLTQKPGSNDNGSTLPNSEDIEKNLTPENKKEVKDAKENDEADSSKLEDAEINKDTEENIEEKIKEKEHNDAKKDTNKNKTLEQKEEKSNQAKINDSISKESEKGVVKNNEKALENEDLKKKDSIENNSPIEADINKQKD